MSKVKAKKSGRKGKVNVTQQLVQLFRDIPTYSVEAATQKFNVTKSLAYSCRRKAGVRIERLGGDDDQSNQLVLSLSLQLPRIAGLSEIKVRNGGGALLGTLILNAEGLSYRRPNQKLPVDRVIRWETLDKLMQVGFV